MAEGSKVRVVRCPKCENLLPELPDYPVYLCGGCGAVLRAKKKSPSNDALSEKSDDENGRGVSEKLESLSEKGAVSLGSCSETEKESDGVEHGSKKESVLGGKPENLISSSVSRTENREIVNGHDMNMKREAMGLRVDRSSEDREVDYVEKYQRFSKPPIDKWVHGGDEDRNQKMSKLGGEKQVEETASRNGNAAGSLKSSVVADGWGVGREELGAFRRNSREQGRFSTSPYPDEGPSNFHPGSFYGYGQPMKHHDNIGGPNRTENLEQDRVELLRKLDELKDQLSRSCDVEDKPRERVPIDGRMAPLDPYGRHDAYAPECPSRMSRGLMQPFAPDKHVREPPYFSHSHGSVPFMNGHDMDMQSFYPPARHVPDEIPGYEDPFQPQVLRRATTRQPPHQYLQRPYHEYFSGQYMEYNQDPFASYHETFFHQPTCSCVRCCNKNWQVPPQVPPTSFGKRRFPIESKNPNFYHHVNPPTFGSRGYNSRGSNPPLHPRDPQPHTRWPSDIDSDIGGFSQFHPRRVVVAHGNRRLCHPIVGGAPFITCYNCFELLKVPRKLMLMDRNQRKLQCGACSCVNFLEVENKKVIVSVPTQMKRRSPDADDGSCEVLDHYHPSSHAHLNVGGTNSDDFDISGYNFQSIDPEPNLPSKDCILIGEAAKRQVLLSSSPSSTEDEESPDSMIGQRDISSSAELPLKEDVSPPLLASPLQENFDYSSNHAMSRHGKGNKSKRTDEEKVILSKATSRQNSVKDPAVATEMEVCFNEYLNTGLSQESVEVSKEEDRPKNNKGSDSFFAGLIKKSFRDFTRSNHSMDNSKPKVSVNGQPIPERAVKKAEKQAGPVQPGEYWYDFRAGFWGVMGQPCLGIIPPFIEEFNCSMPEDCSSGNTGVFVNGRELHQKDLDLLASRGLPTTRDKSYIIEISGRVLDEDTGEELDSLGKLAPT
ncbi:hypothetical protein PVL29_001615 [Vitis rotundifolia]|nr:hypothetical protein PVL29_001615 [Vitis rotundifolia]